MKTLAALLLILAPCAGLAFSPDLPAGARQLTDEERSRAYYELPLGPFKNGVLPTERARGLVRLQTWRIEGQGGAVTEIAEALGAQLIAEGYELVFHCQTDDCGGFDFRFETLVLPPPEMFVDLANFRFLSARRETSSGPEVAGVLLSNTSSAAMVQVISVAPMQAVNLSLVDAEKREEQEAALLEPAELDQESGIDSGPTAQSAPTRPVDTDTTGLISALTERGHVVLGGLSFQTGSSNLAEGPFESLETLAAWLKQDEKRRVALVGHTDSKGGLDSNVKLSLARATSVRDHMTKNLSVPSAQLEAHGIGFLAPIASNNDEAGRDANRRVEAVLLSTP